MFRELGEEPVLVDLGIVRDLSKSSLTMSWVPRGPCSPLYASPEQLNNEKAMIDWRTDQFCLGLVLGSCLYGYHPHLEEGVSPGEAIENVASHKYYSSEFKKLAIEQGCRFILRMLEPWPVRRFVLPSDIIDEIKEGQS